MAAGAASTPNMNCFDVENSAKNKIGQTDPYKPYTAGSPAICAYPIEIGMETAAIIIPEKISFKRNSFLYSLRVGNNAAFITFFTLPLLFCSADILFAGLIPDLYPPFYRFIFYSFYNMKKAENDSVISDNHSRFLRPSPRGFEPPTPRLGESNTRSRLR